MAERCRPGAKMRHGAAGGAHACRGKENRERRWAETLPEEKAGLRGGKRGMRRAESACVGSKGGYNFLLACLLACLLAWRLFVSHFGRGGGYGVSRRFFQIRIRMVGLLSAIGRCGFTLRPTHRCPANPSLVSACRRSASPVAGGCCGLRFRL
ncbi:TPA: hypothetical protein ACLAWW_001328 [Neisseria meningitidis]|nr:hypothetical protein [Neisseria meningitidis]